MKQANSATRKKIVQQYYSKRAHDYDWQKARTWKNEKGFGTAVLNEIIGAVLWTETGLGLEVGIGSGRVSLPLVEETKLRIVGLDLSKEMLRLVKKKICHSEARVDLLLGDAEHLPFRNKTFNLLLCISTLHYFDSFHKPLMEFSRVLKTNGVFIYGDVTMHEMDTEEFLSKLEKMLSPAHGRYHKPSEMKKILEEHGFQLTKTKTIPYRKRYASLVEDKGKYFRVKPWQVSEFIEKATKEGKALYEMNKDEMALFYSIICGTKIKDAERERCE